MGKIEENKMNKRRRKGWRERGEAGRKKKEGRVK